MSHPSHINKIMMSQSLLTGFTTTCLGVCLWVVSSLLTQPLHAESDNRDAVEHVLWQRTPIVVTLPIGTERQVRFEEPVEVINHQPELTHDKLTITNNAGTVYFKATAPLTPARLAMHLLQSHTVVLLDINTTDAPQADSTPISVMLPDNASSTESTKTGDAGQHLPNTTPHTNPIALVRFAISEIYASSIPLSYRLPDVHRIPLRTNRHVDLFYGANTTAMPLSSWRSQDWTVTAVAVQNTLSTPIVIDPRNVHGNWVAMSIFPRNALAPQGHPAAMTTVFLLSHRAFQDSLSAVPRFQHPPIQDEPLLTQGALPHTPVYTPEQSTTGFSTTRLNNHPEITHHPEITRREGIIHHGA